MCQEVQQQLTNMNTHYLRNPTTKLVAKYYNTGGGRPTAVAPQPLGLWRCFQGKSWRLYLYFAYKSGFKRVRAILKAVEAVKVKLWCFKGIVHPTHFQKQVGWGTWLLGIALVGIQKQILPFFILAYYTGWHIWQRQRQTQVVAIPLGPGREKTLQRFRVTVQGLAGWGNWIFSVFNIACEHLPLISEKIWHQNYIYESNGDCWSAVVWMMLFVFPSMKPSPDPAPVLDPVLLLLLRSLFPMLVL